MMGEAGSYMGSGSLQHTVASPAVLAGVGVHSGAAVRLEVRAAPVDSGIVFVRRDIADRDNRVPVSAAAVVRTQLHTEICNAAGVTVSTIEHLMAALVMTGVDNALVELDGAELPMMDGSSAPFVQALDRAGLRVQDSPRRYIEMVERVEVRQGDKLAALTPLTAAPPRAAPPGCALELDVEIAFSSQAIGRQRVVMGVDANIFRRDIAPARSFGFVREVEMLRAQGLARGGDLSNVIVIDGDRVINPEGLRFSDEFVRHKALDAIGDLFVLGSPIIGRFEGRYPGHGINNALARALLAQPSAFRVRTFAPSYAQAV